MTSASRGASNILSVVVIGRNEGARLLQCLGSVHAMHRGAVHVELIYVDSGSTDDSVGLAESMGARVIALQPERPSAALGRNAGWMAASGEFVLFLDGDTVLDPEFVQASLPDFADPEIAVVWGHRRESNKRGSLYNRALDLDWVYAPGRTEFCGGDALMRRDVLLAMGGFDATLIAGEEPELCRRMIGAGYSILHVDRPMTGHDLAITHFSQYWKRAVRAGHAFAEVSERFAKTSQPFWTEELRRNRYRALGLAGTVLLGLVASLLLRSALPAAVVLLLLVALAVRTSLKASWKTIDPFALALYGVHSHFQQLPIFVGQMQYRRNKRAGTHAGLVEYKRP